MMFRIRKSRAAFQRWYKYYIKDAEVVIRTYKETSLFYAGREDLYHEAISILNQYESLKLSLTVIENSFTRTSNWERNIY